MPERQGTESTLNKNGRCNFRNGPKWLLFRRLAGKRNFAADVSFYKHRMGVLSLEVMVIVFQIIPFYSSKNLCCSKINFIFCVAQRWWWSCFRLFLFTPLKMCVARRWWRSCFIFFPFTPLRMCVALSIKSCVEFWSPDIPLDIPPQSTFHCLYNNIFRSPDITPDIK